MLAALGGHVAVCELLLHAGCSVEQRSTLVCVGGTPAAALCLSPCVSDADGRHSAAVCRKGRCERAMLVAPCSRCRP